MPVRRKPVWSEGLLVSQHHFQAQDQYHERIVHERVSARRFAWGITELEVDERLLQTGQFALRRLAAVWPDGLVVDCGGPSGDPPPAPRPFESYLRDDGGSLDVWVGIGQEGGTNVGPLGSGGGSERFSRTTDSVSDFNEGGSPQDVEFAVPNLRFVFGTERRERLATLPIAQLVRTSEGKIALRDTFVPPVLNIAAAPFVVGGLRRVLGAMVARQREVASQRKQRSGAAIEFHFTDARRFWLLHTLNTSIPVLTHYLDVERVHPEEVYLALSSLVGALGTFAADGDVTSAPKFNYAELGDVFEHLFARVLALLSVDASPAYTEIPLERRPDGMFVGKIPEPRLVSHEFFVAVQSTMPEALVRERVPALLKIAGWKHISDVVRQARHGVRTEVEFYPSSSLPLKPGLCFFRVQREGQFWEEVAKSRTMALYVPNDADWKDVWVRVYAVDPAYLR